MKQLLMSLATILLGAPLLAEDTKTPNYNPDLLIFAGDLRTYVAKARALAELDETKDSESSKEAIVKDLQAAGSRLGKVYFSETAETIKTELDTHLALALKENKNLKNYFIFLGNAFAEQASAFLMGYQKHQRSIRMMWLAGGAAVGLVIGGGYIFVKLKQTTNVALTSKDYLIAGGAVLGGTAIGFGWGTHQASSLPMDNSVINAKDFAAKYPHGEDFINSLNRSSDLKLLASELLN